jgi:hypothetical protein
VVIGSPRIFSFANTPEKGVGSISSMKEGRVCIYVGRGEKDDRDEERDWELLCPCRPSAYRLACSGEGWDREYEYGADEEYK